MSKVIVERSGRGASLLRSRMFRYTSILSVVILLCTVVLPLWRLFPDIYGREVIPLHYNIHYGVDWTGVWWQIFLLPVMGVVFLLVNTVMALFFVRRNSMLTDVALAANVVLAALLFSAMVFVVSLNIVYG